MSTDESRKISQLSTLEHTGNSDSLLELFDLHNNPKDRRQVWLMDILDLARNMATPPSTSTTENYKSPSNGLVRESQDTAGNKQRQPQLSLAGTDLVSNIAHPKVENGQPSFVLKPKANETPLMKTGDLAHDPQQTVFLHQDSLDNNLLNKEMPATECSDSSQTKNAQVAKLSLSSDFAESNEHSRVIRFLSSRLSDPRKLEIGDLRKALRNPSISLEECLELLESVKADMRRANGSNVVQRLLPFLQLRQYDIVLEDFNNSRTESKLDLLKLLCTKLPANEPFRLATLSTLSCLMFKLEPTEVAELLKSVKRCPQLKRACKLLSPPNFQYKFTADRWLLSQISVMVDSSRSGARRLLIMILLHLAMEFNHNFLAGTMIVNFSKSAPNDEERASVVPPVLVSAILDRILTAVENTQRSELIELVVKLWKCLISVGGNLSKSQQFRLLELTLDLTKDETGSGLAIGPDAVLQLIEKQQDASRIPLTYYWDTIRRLLKVQNITGAMRNTNLMLSQESQMSSHPPRLIAYMLHSLTRHKMYADAASLVARMDKKTMTRPIILEQLINFCARTNNESLGNKLVELIPRPLSRRMLKQLLFYSIRTNDETGRNQVLATIRKGRVKLSAPELGMIAQGAHENSGVTGMVEFTRQLPPNIQSQVWRAVLKRSLGELRTDIANEAALKSKRDRNGYYLNTLLTYVSRSIGVSSAVRIVQKLLDKAATKADPLGNYLHNELRVAVRELDKLHDGHIRYEFKVPRMSNISPDLFLQPVSRSPRSRARMRRAALGREKSHATLLSNEHVDMALFEGCQPDYVTVMILARLALAEGNYISFNWALLALESMGMAAVDIERAFEAEVAAFKQGSAYVQYGIQKRRTGNQ